MFEKAAKLKYRYKADAGVLNTEDLFSVPLTTLDKLAKGLRKELQELQEESFLSESNATTTLVADKFELVKYVIKTRLDEKQARKDALLKAEQRAKILGILADKRDSALMAKSEEELLKELSELSN